MGRDCAHVDVSCAHVPPGLCNCVQLEKEARVELDAQLRKAQQEAHAKQLDSAATAGQLEGQLKTLSVRSKQLEVRRLAANQACSQSHSPSSQCPVNVTPSRH